MTAKTSVPLCAAGMAKQAQQARFTLSRPSWNRSSIISFKIGSRPADGRQRSQEMSGAEAWGLHGRPKLLKPSCSAGGREGRGGHGPPTTPFACPAGLQATAPGTALALHLPALTTPPAGLLRGWSLCPEQSHPPEWCTPMPRRSMGRTPPIWGSFRSSSAKEGGVGWGGMRWGEVGVGVCGVCAGGVGGGGWEERVQNTY